MPITIQKISQYGTATPLIARGALQADRLMQPFPIPDDVRSRVRAIVFECQQHLENCQEIRDVLAREIESEISKFSTGRLQEGAMNAIVLPNVPNLRGRAESFLQCAKLAIRDAARILEPFYGQEFDHRFQRIHSWAETRWPNNDPLVQYIAACEPWVRTVVEMRNSVDHPATRGPLIVKNFHLTSLGEQSRVEGPCWRHQGHDLRSIKEHMDEIINRILRIAEDFLCMCLTKHRRDMPLLIREIPEEQRDPRCPFRLEVDLDLSSLPRPVCDP